MSVTFVGTKSSFHSNFMIFIKKKNIHLVERNKIAPFGRIGNILFIKNKDQVPMWLDLNVNCISLLPWRNRFASLNVTSIIFASDD